MTGHYRVVFLVALVGILFLTAGVGTVAAQTAPDCSTVSYNGDGTEANPYEVGNVNELQCIGDEETETEPEDKFIQVSDIDASATSSWNNGDGFDPVSIEEKSTFDGEINGKFDGQEYSITDLTIDRPTESDVGLFGTVEGSIMNVSVIDADITGDAFVGGVAGRSTSESTIRDSHVTGTIDGGSFLTGGLVGVNDATSTIEDSYMAGSVSGSRRVGGLVGRNKGTIEDSYATGATDGMIDIGGFVGENRGNEGQGNLGVISGSYSAGSVDGSRNVGGFVGGSVGINNDISNSYSMASVEGNQLVGGFVGSAGGGTTISNSYAKGSVTGSSEVGGFIGRASGSTTNSYWDTQTTGQSTSDGDGEGLTTSQMTGSAATNNMQGFDFTNTWVTVSGDHPILAWQKPTPAFTLSTNSPAVDEAITFDASSSRGPDGSIQSYEWDFDGDGNTDTTRQVPLATHTYTNPGTFVVTLTVTDDDGTTGTTTETVTVEQDMGGSVVDNYRNSNGNVDTGGLQQAINDFIQDPNVGTGDLQAVINAFIAS